VALSFKLTKNWLVALLISLVRAIERVPLRFLSPFVASFLIEASVVFCIMFLSDPPPCMTKPGMTRWKVVPS